ncbi:hypothetical protein [Roseibium limicola]|uniref:Uncharacterized protein n=1 Tax=Roseibium limicola TaxID=2816037 RepID=A0A939J983_9HYPH|nr:hypothetical protein [Roseibium limicola]MBO0345128.1 hypothetical protein [Roseibium limicola]
MDRENTMMIGIGHVLAAALLCHFGVTAVLAGGMDAPTGDPQPIPAPARPEGGGCDAYARAYADQFLGSGDPIGDVITRGMEGAAEGGAWGGPRGARRGARAGGAQAVLDNLAAYPGGWQALYDMAYQICSQENAPDCRSSAGVGVKSRGALGARSGACR